MSFCFVCISSETFNMLNEYKTWKIEHTQKMDAYLLESYKDKSKNTFNLADEHQSKKLKSSDDNDGKGSKLVCLPVKYLQWVFEIN